VSYVGQKCSQDSLICATSAPGGLEDGRSRKEVEEAIYKNNVVQGILINNLKTFLKKIGGGEIMAEKKKGEKPFLKGSITKTEQYGTQVALWLTPEAKKMLKITVEEEDY
jgi:hypothetical protein